MCKRSFRRRYSDEKNKNTVGAASGLGEYSGAQLFLPAAGEIDEYDKENNISERGSKGIYFSTEPGSAYYAAGLTFTSTTAAMGTPRRDDAVSVRAVYVGN